MCRPSLARAVHVHGQGAGGAEHAWTPRIGGNGAGRENERGRLADDAAVAKITPDKMPGTADGSTMREHRAQLARAQAEAALAVRIGHCHQRLLGGAHDDRQHHDGQREGTGHQDVAPLQQP